MRLPIRANQSVRLRLMRDETDRWYRSVIVDFDEGQELVLLLPSQKDRETLEEDETPEGNGSDEGADGSSGAGEGEPATVPQPQLNVGDDSAFLDTLFDRGTRLEVEIPFPDGIRRFTSVVRRIDLGYGGAIRVEWPSEATRIQRRDYVRVDVSFTAIASFRLEKGKLEQLNGRTIDFSVGGVRLKLEEPLPEDLRIQIEIQGTPLRQQTLQGRVVRSGELPKKGDNVQYYWVAVEFIGVDEALRKDLTQMVFEIQREHMKKNLT